MNLYLERFVFFLFQEYSVARLLSGARTWKSASPYHRQSLPNFWFFGTSSWGPNLSLLLLLLSITRVILRETCGRNLVPWDGTVTGANCTAWVTTDYVEIDNLANKIVAEVKALETKGGTDGAENSEFTYLAAVESAPQFHCPTCGNRVRGSTTLHLPIP